MKDLIAIIVTLAALIAAWRLIAQMFQKKGFGKVTQHFAGGVVGLCAAFVVMIALAIGGVIESDNSKSSQASVSNADLESLYSIVNDDTKAPYKRTVEVRLEKRIDKDQLVEIAKIVKANEIEEVKRTFISYRLAEQKGGGAYWATTNYNPDLDVQILGTTAAEQQQVESQYTGPTQFDSVASMIEAFGDYSVSNNTYELVSQNPLKIRLSPIEFKGTPSDVIRYDVKRAVIYGVYRSFIHTSANEISLEVTPLNLLDIKTKELRLMPQYTASLTLTRSQALAVVQKFLDVKTLSDLISPAQYSNDAWSPDFETLYYEDSQPGLDVFFTELMEESS